MSKMANHLLEQEERDPVRYSREYDAYYDIKRDVWLEAKCSDSCDCEFCHDRPDKPSQMKTMFD